LDVSKAVFPEVTSVLLSGSMERKKVSDSAVRMGPSMESSVVGSTVVASKRKVDVAGGYVIATVVRAVVVLV